MEIKTMEVGRVMDGWERQNEREGRERMKSAYVNCADGGNVPGKGVL
jgi:hypothetical protein